MNPKDPLIQNHDAARELFRQLGQVCRGFPVEHVRTAALNLLVNAIRTEAPTQTIAERVWDEAVGRQKGHLMSCYDAAGRKKGIFPYTQNLDVGFMQFPDKINGG